MLTEGNKKYLQSISDTEIAKIAAFNPDTQRVAKELTEKLKTVLPKARVIYFGSSALGIAGENDIDLGVIDANEFNSGAKKLKDLYGEPVKIDEKHEVMRWEFEKNGFIVELFLSNALAGRHAEHVKNHERLAKDENLRKIYKDLKISCEGLSKREYMKKKLEFFNAMNANHEPEGV